MPAQWTDTDEMMYLSTIEASKIPCSLGLPTAPSTLTKLRCIGFYNMIRQGNLKAVKMGKMTLVLTKDLNEWLEKLSPQSRRPTPIPRRMR
jgi:hypothetical protein